MTQHLWTWYYFICSLFKRENLFCIIIHSGMSLAWVSLTKGLNKTRATATKWLKYILLAKSFFNVSFFLKTNHYFIETHFNIFQTEQTKVMRVL